MKILWAISSNSNLIETKQDFTTLNQKVFTVINLNEKLAKTIELDKNSNIQINAGGKIFNCSEQKVYPTQSLEKGSEFLSPEVDWELKECSQSQKNSSVEKGRFRHFKKLGI